MRSVPLLYGTVTVTLVALAVAIALSSPPPRTPPLAAVAPQPQERIEQAVRSQDSRFGGGAGATGDCVGAGCEGVPPDGPQEAGQRAGPTEIIASQPGTTVTAPPNPGIHRCANGPGGARQTEDPQSPPCVAEVWSGDNGGATARGVTASTIRVALPLYWRSEGGFPPNLRRAIDTFVQHINDRYELYGRRIELVEVPDDGRKYRDPEVARSIAQDIAALEPFASLELAAPSQAFYATLAANGVVATSGELSSPIMDVSSLEALHPYVWSINAELRDQLHAGGDLICTALTGRPASHAGADLATRERSFGVFVDVWDGVSGDPTPLTSRLSACGAPHDVYEDPGRDDGEELETVFRKMQADGVTTVVCVCATFYRWHAAAADEIGWEPEWLLVHDDGVPGEATSRNSVALSRNQLAHVFGIAADMPFVGKAPGGTAQRYDEHYWYQVMREHDPSIQLDATVDKASELYGYYAQLLVLASGIQWAGPELTPETFGAALQRLRYPNPGVGAPPWYQPGVGFGPADHGFNSDFALFWWQTPPVDTSSSNTANSYNHGRVCYVGDGARFAVGSFPADADQRLFDPNAGC